MNQYRWLGAAPPLVVAAILLAGCGTSTRGGDGTDTESPRHFPGISATKQRELERMVKLRVKQAKTRKSRQLAANARILDSVRPFPGAKLIRSWQSPNQSWRSTTSDAAELFDSFAGWCCPADYVTLTAASWGTERDYVVPRGVPPERVRSFVVSQLLGTWVTSVSVRYGSQRRVTRTICASAGLTARSLFGPASPSPAFRAQGEVSNS